MATVVFPSAGRTPCKSTATIDRSAFDIDHVAALRGLARDVAALRAELRFGLSCLAVLLACNSQQPPHLVSATIAAAALLWLLTRIVPTIAPPNAAAHAPRTTVTASQLLTPIPPSTSQREAAAAECIATAERTVAGGAATPVSNVCMSSAEKISGDPSLVAPRRTGTGTSFSTGFSGAGTACPEGKGEAGGGLRGDDGAERDNDLVLRPRALSDALERGVGQADDARIEAGENVDAHLAAAANCAATEVDTGADTSTEDAGTGANSSADSEFDNELSHHDTMESIILEHSLCDCDEASVGDDSCDVLARSVTSEGSTDGFVSSPSPEPKCMRQAQMLMPVPESTVTPSVGLRHGPELDGDGDGGDNCDSDSGGDGDGDDVAGDGDDRVSGRGGDGGRQFGQEWQAGAQQSKADTAACSSLPSPTPAALVQGQGRGQGQEGKQEQEQGQTRRPVLPQPHQPRQQLQCPSAPIRQPVAWRRQRRRQQQEEEEQQERRGEAHIPRCARHATDTAAEAHSSCPVTPAMAPAPVLVRRAKGKGLGLRLKSGLREEQECPEVIVSGADAKGRGARSEGGRRVDEGAGRERAPPLTARKAAQTRTPCHQTGDADAEPTLQLALCPASHASAPLFSSKWLGLSPLPPPMPSPTSSWPGASSPLHMRTPTGLGGMSTPLKTPTNAGVGNADHGWAGASPLRASAAGFSTPRYARACLGSPAATVAAAVAMALSPQWSSPPSSPSLTLSPQLESETQAEKGLKQGAEATGVPVAMVVGKRKECVRVEAAEEPLTPSPRDSMCDAHGIDSSSEGAREAVEDASKCSSDDVRNSVGDVPSSPTPQLLMTPVLRAIDMHHTAGVSIDRGTCKGNLRSSATGGCGMHHASSPNAPVPLPPPFLSLPGGTAQLQAQQPLAAPVCGSALALNSPSSSQTNCDWSSPRPAGPRSRARGLRRSQRRPRLNLLEQARASPRKRVLPPSPLSLPTPMSDETEHCVRGNSVRSTPILALPPSPASSLGCSTPRTGESMSGDCTPGTPTPTRAEVAASPHMHVITALSPLPRSWCASPSVARSLTGAGMNLATAKGSMRQRCQLLALTNNSGSDGDSDSDVESDLNTCVNADANNDAKGADANAVLDNSCKNKDRVSVLRRRPMLMIDTNAVVGTVTNNVADVYSETCVGTEGIEEPHSAKRKKSYDEVRRKVSFESLCASPCGVPSTTLSASASEHNNCSSINTGDDRSDHTDYVNDSKLCSKPEVAKGNERTEGTEDNGANEDNEDSLGTEGTEGTKDAEAADAIEGGLEHRSSAPIFAANFIILHPLGTGSFAEVTCCRCRADGRRYAVKRSRKRFRGKRDRARLYREFDVGSALVVRDDADKPTKWGIGSALRDTADNEIGAVADAGQAHAHPHIVSYYSAFQEEGFLHIQMELCSRGTLRSVLELCCSRGLGRGATQASGAPSDLSHSLQLLPVALCEPLVWSCICSLARGITHVHSHGFVHLDLKPDNVFVSASGVLKIGDFGQADVIGANADGAEGDSVYMAAELLNSVDLGAVEWSAASKQTRRSTCADAAECSGDGGGDGDLDSPRTPMVSTHGVQPAADMFSIGAIALELSTALLRVGGAANECWRDETSPLPLPFTLPRSGARWVALRRGDVPCLHGKLAREAGWSYGRTPVLANTVIALLGSSASRPSAQALARDAGEYLAVHSEGSTTGTGASADEDPTISIDRYMLAQSQIGCGSPDPHAVMSRSKRVRQLRKRPSLRVIINKRSISQQQHMRQQHHDKMRACTSAAGAPTGTGTTDGVEAVHQ